MPLRLSFNLRDEDLRHLEEVAQQAQARTREQSADAIIATARSVLEQGERAHVAQFVRDRFVRLRAMLEMATDADWQPSADDRQRLLNALACFGSAEHSAGAVGLLEHGIMIELVSRDLEHDLDAYQAFCKLREQAAKRRRPGAEQVEQRDQWLAQKQAELQVRMRERRERDLDKAGSAVRKLFSLFRL